MANYIASIHHAYTKKELPEILAYLQKVSSKHGDRHPELRQVLDAFIPLKEELELHMRKEDFVLFPAIKKLEDSSGEAYSTLDLSSPVAVMEDEHARAGSFLQQIREQTNDYTPPPDACTTYRLTLAKLATLESDLHQHIHLENNILFPKALDSFEQKTQIRTRFED